MKRGFAGDTMLGPVGEHVDLPLVHVMAKVGEVADAVVGELRALVPEEAGDVAAVLPTDLRDLWQRR